MPSREMPPMPAGVVYDLTVREDGGEGTPVAVLHFVDATQETLTLHLDERVLRDLVVDGAVALRQLGRGFRSMPDPWLHS